MAGQTLLLLAGWGVAKGQSAMLGERRERDEPERMCKYARNSSPLDAYKQLNQSSLMTKTTYSTDEVGAGTFRPHGRVEYEVRGNVLWTRAIGPFNVELANSMEELVRVIFPEMAQKGTWVNLCVFEHSALCSNDVLAHLCTLGKRVVDAGLAPSGLAFVLPSDVEGASLMGPLYNSCMVAAGLRFEWFSTVELASNWASSLLHPEGK